MKKVRNGHRLFVRKKLSEVEALIPDCSCKEKLFSLKELLEEKSRLLDDLNAKILEKVDEADLESEIEESSDFASAIRNKIVSINIQLNKIDSVSGGNMRETQQVDESSDPNAGDQPPAAMSSMKSPQVSQIKLPELSMKLFDGNPSEFQEFWDSFDSAVHQNQSISDIHKMNYLKGLLKGAAASAIAGLSLSNSNYAIAVEILQERFGKKQIAISSHMDSLLKLQKLTSANDISKIRAVYDSIESHVRSLSSLGVEAETYGPLFIPIMMEKLPEELKLVISRKIKSEVWSIADVLEAFRHELEAREKCKIVGSSTLPASNYHPKSSQPVTAATLQTSNASHAQAQTACFFCDGDHKSGLCGNVIDVQARRAIIKRKGKCFLCFRSGHKINACTSKYKCFDCGGRHNKALCDKKRAREASPSRNDAVSVQSTSSTMYINSDTSVLLQTATAPVSRPDDPNSQVQARIIFDSCSQRSYVSERMCKALNLPSIGTDNLLIKAFGDESPRLRACNVVQLSITSVDGMKLYVKAYSVPTICSPLSNQAVKLAVEKYPHLQGLQLADIPESADDVEIDVLIGADYYWNFFDGAVRQGRGPGPVALSTKLGWVLSGPMLPSGKRSSECSVNLNPTHVLRVDTSTVNINEAELSPEGLQLSKFWDLETLGIRSDEKSVYDTFTEEVKFDGERYEAKLPFKEYHPPLPDNYSTSERRLESLLKRLQGKPDVLKEYDNVIKQQVEEGITEKVHESKPMSVGAVHYLPHREVIRADKETTKLRVVYDASCNTTGTSLNDCLLAGPPLTPMIFDILVRFRAFKVAVVADIEKAFLNISVTPEHRDFLRFLWVDDPFKSCPRVQVLRFCRVVFGVTSSPFILNATIRHHMNTYIETDEQFVKKVLDSLYVDDFVSGANTHQSAYDLCNKVKSVMAKGGFNLRKWQSNSNELVEAMKSECDEKKSSPLTSHEEVVKDGKQQCKSESRPVSDETSPKVLGMAWNNQTDELSFDLSRIVADVEPVVTKRSLLRVAATFYDPLGLISPIILSFKMLFQAVCKKNVGWDDELDDSLSERWRSLIRDLLEVGRISVPRCYSLNSQSEDEVFIELHAFGDASENAYGSCVYIRLEYQSRVHCSLIASKTRVAPMSRMSIPRLELLACLVTARLVRSVLEALNNVSVHSVFYWSDSMVALSWIKGIQKEFKQFVQNRVNEIRKLTSIDSWNYCPTDMNPADLASRGSTATDLVKNRLWWDGPTFLLESKEDRQPESVPLLVEPGEEVSSSGPLKVTVAAVTASEVEDDIEQIIDIKKFNKVSRLLRVTAYVLRFISILKKSDAEKGELSTDEIVSAERIWIKRVQSKIVNSDKFKHMSSSLSLFEDDEGVVRSRGRIENAPLPYDTRFPILLPRKHPFTDLVILSCHEEVMHNGVQETLVQLRSRFWVVKGRQEVKRVINACKICKRLEGKSYGSPPAPPLPSCRL